MKDSDCTNLLDTKSLLHYINKFYGYGNWEVARFWFVGIEEGGGYNINDIEARLDSWRKLGKNDLIDCKIHHSNTNSINLENTHKLHSRTWTRLILTKLGYENINAPTKEQMLEVQANKWGQIDSDNLLVELFPLPSPGVKYWKYPCWVDLNSKLSFLVSRTTYKEKVIADRINYIKSKIEQHQPPVVLFYGKSMESHWDAIIGTSELGTIDILEKERNRIRFKKINKTYVIQCPQPTYIRGYKFWIELGKYIKTLVSS